jgi:sugar (pentulose or hexulose) kinase
MIWMDRRAEPQAAAVAARIAPDEFYRHVGANLDSSHAVFKALWVRDEEPEVFARVKHVMPPGSYVLWKTSGVLAVDYSNASSLALLDPRTRTWSDEVLDATGIDRAMLPELGAGTKAVGTVTAAFAEATGLAPDTVVAIGCGDEMAATLGAGVFAPGEVCDVVGTAEPVCAASSEPREVATVVSPACRSRRMAARAGFVSGGNLVVAGSVRADRRAPGEGWAAPTCSRARPSACRPARRPGVPAGVQGAWRRMEQHRGVFCGSRWPHSRAPDARRAGGRLRPATS